MKRVGLTGGFGSGKSTVAGFLREQGIPIVDADQAAKEVTAPGSELLSQIAARFGSDLIRANGQLDRARLAEQVFRDPLAVADLNALLHPPIRAHLEKKIAELAAMGHSWAVLEVPLLFESGWNRDMVQTILVWAPTDVCIERLIRNKRFSREAIEARISHQMPIDQKRELSDFVIDNSGTVESCYEQTLAIVRKLRKTLPPAP